MMLSKGQLSGGNELEPPIPPLHPILSRIAFKANPESHPPKNRQVGIRPQPV